MKLYLGLKLGSRDTQYTADILRDYEQGVFQYIELFTLTGSYDDTVSYWRQFDIPCRPSAGERQKNKVQSLFSWDLQKAQKKLNFV